MKKILLSFTAITMFFACSSDDDSNNKPVEPVNPLKPFVENLDLPLVVKVNGDELYVVEAKGLAYTISKTSIDDGSQLS